MHIYCNITSFKFYVYAYLREDLSPYYIGKGSGKRAWEHGKKDVTHPPNNKALIVLLETNLSEVGAFALERRYIRWYGRKDLETGILRNMADGGQGPSGAMKSESHKQKIRESNLGKKRSEKTKQKQRGPKSEQHKQNMRKSKSTTINMQKPKEKYICSYCQKSAGGASNFERWHNHNCISNPSNPNYGTKRVIPLNDRWK